MSGSEKKIVELTQEEAAKRLGITTRQLRRIPDEYTGRLANRRYPWPEVRNGYRRWVKQAEQRQAERVSDEKRERARKLALQARKLELEVAELEGRLIPIEVHEERYAALCEEFAGVVKSLAGRWAPFLRFERTIAETQAEIKRLANEVLTELADGRTQIRDDDDEGDGDSSADAAG